MKTVTHFMQGILFWIYLFFVSACENCVSSCKSYSFDQLSDNLFDKEILRYYDIPWLLKPENTTEKSFYKSDEQWHVYETYIQDEQNFWNYGEYIYATFIEKNYTLGLYVKQEDSGFTIPQKRWTIVRPLTHFADCKRSLDIEIYYSKRGVDPELDVERNGYAMKNPNLIRLCLKKQEDTLILTIRCKRKDNVYLAEKSDEV